MGDREARGWAESSAEDRVFRAVEQHEVWLAEHDGIVLGWVEVDQGRIEAIYTRPDVARQGIGSMLLLHAESEIRTAGHPTVTLEASSNAEAFYLHRGYEPQSLLVVQTGARPMLKRLR